MQNILWTVKVIICRLPVGSTSNEKLNELLGSTYNLGRVNIIAGFCQYKECSRFDTCVGHGVTFSVPLLHAFACL